MNAAFRNPSPIGDLERARRSGRRAFFDVPSGTVRSCPEDFCLVVVRGERWTVLVDRRAAAWEPAVAAVIASAPLGIAPEDLAARVGAAIAAQESAS